LLRRKGLIGIPGQFSKVAAGLRKFFEPVDGAQLF
jgi:hypothetical protein